MGGLELANAVPKKATKSAKISATFQRDRIWKKDPPATTGVGITELEQGAEVEIEALAIVPSG